ncbi:MAG: hypothetical protein JWN04_4367 [Myxococcaceae bacterium]|nr:hypothetical protein [Myxococcaceae bacterium]
MSEDTVVQMAAESDDDVVVNLRLPRTWLTRVDALVPLLEKREEARASGVVSRSTILRLMLLRGMGALEEEQRLLGADDGDTTVMGPEELQQLSALASKPLLAHAASQQVSEEKKNGEVSKKPRTPTKRKPPVKSERPHGKNQGHR